jgi:glycosyltransferase involved in cell wall biosynthesis
MNIGFDGKRATNNLTGLGNYSRSLVAQLAAYFPQNQYFVYSARVKAHPQINSFLNLKGIILKRAESSVLWRSFRILKQLKADKIALYHGLSQELPFGISSSGIKSVVTIHDLIYLRFPKYFSFIDRQIYRLKAKHACRNGNGIIAISERTKQDLIELLDVPAEKIRVIYQSCDDSFQKEFSTQFKQEVRTKYSLPTKYLLNVGTIEPRKNLMLVVQALANLPAEISLVVIGKPQAYAAEVKAEIERLKLAARVVFLQDVSFLELPVIYQLAEVFVYPSRYEGFGIPVIEALNCGVPVVAATGSCLEEAGGPDSVYVDPDDPLSLANVISSILQDAQKQSRMKEKGLAFVRRFNKAAITKQLHEYYQEISTKP